MLTVGQVAENCFVLNARGSRGALVVDPGDEAERIVAAIEEKGLDVEGILLTHTHFDHIGAVAPVARATGAPVWCPEIETPVLADINSFVPWPGFGPFEDYEADHTVSGGEKLQLAGLDIDVIFTPAIAPDTSPIRSPARARSSPATSSSRARSGAPTCRAGTGRPSSNRSARLWTGTRPRPRSIRATWASPPSAQSVNRTRSCRAR